MRMPVVTLGAVALLLAACGGGQGRVLSTGEVSAAVRQAGLRVAGDASVQRALKALEGRGFDLRKMRATTPDYLWLRGRPGARFVLLRRFATVAAAKRHPAVAALAPRLVCNVEIDDFAHTAGGRLDRLARDAADRVARMLARRC